MNDKIMKSIMNLLRILDGWSAGRRPFATSGAARDLLLLLLQALVVRFLSFDYLLLDLDLVRILKLLPLDLFWC